MNYQELRAVASITRGPPGRHAASTHGLSFRLHCMAHNEVRAEGLQTVVRIALVELSYTMYEVMGKL